MKKLIFVGNKLFGVGGIERMTEYFGKSFSEFYDVYYLSINKSNKKIDIKNTKNKWFFTIKKNRLLALLGYIKVYFKLLILRPKHIILQSIYSNYFKYFFFLKKKIIFVDHGYFSFLVELNFESYKKIIENVFSISSKIIVLTRKMQDFLISDLKLPQSKIHLISNFVEVENTDTKYNKNSKIVVSCGRLEEQKNFLLLIKAFSMAIKDHPDWKLEIYGDGTERQMLSSEIIKQNMENNIFLKGNYKTKDECYKDKAFFVMSSILEGLGLVLLEAKYYSLPIISTDCYSGPSDIIQNGIDGYLVENRNEFELATKIEELISNQELRIQMSSRSKNILKEYNKDKIVGEWLKLLAK